VALAVCLVLTPPLALAQGPEPKASDDELAAGRALFAEALADQGAGRLRPALEKFQRVQRIKDTASIEYRIGTCHEGLGHAAQAYGAYRSAVALGERDAAMSDVVHAARARLDALARHVARLTLVLPDAAPADLAVRVDDEPLAPQALGQPAQPVPLEPGTHTVVAEAAGRTPFRSQIALPEGAEASLAISLAAVAPPAPVAPEPRPAEAEPSGGHSGHTVGWIFVAAGAGLAAGSVATLLLRQADIATLDSHCPSGLCPPGSNESDLTATHDRAVVEGPLAAGLGAAAVVAAALGVYWVLSAPSPPAARAFLAPTLSRRGSGATMAVTF
jgi:hypothetical protein